MAIQTITYPSTEKIRWPTFIYSIFQTELLSLINDYANENYIEFVQGYIQNGFQQITWTSNLSRGMCFLGTNYSTIIPLKCYSINIEHAVFYKRHNYKWYNTVTTFGELSFETFQTWEDRSKHYHLAYLKPECPRLSMGPQSQKELNQLINELYQKKCYKYNYWLLYYSPDKIYIRCFKSKESILEQIQRIKQHLGI